MWHTQECFLVHIEQQKKADEKSSLSSLSKPQGEPFKANYRIHCSFTCWSNFRLRYIKKPKWQDLKQPCSHILVQIRCNYKPYLGERDWNLMLSLCSLSLMFLPFVTACLSYVCTFRPVSFVCQLSFFSSLLLTKSLNHSTHTGSCDPANCLVVLPTCSMQYKGTIRAVWDWLVIEVRVKWVLRERKQIQNILAVKAGPSQICPLYL